MQTALKVSRAAITENPIYVTERFGLRVEVVGAAFSYVPVFLIVDSQPASLNE